MAKKTITELNNAQIEIDPDGYMSLDTQGEGKAELGRIQRFPDGSAFVLMFQAAAADEWRVITYYIKDWPDGFDPVLHTAELRLVGITNKETGEERRMLAMNEIPAEHKPHIHAISKWREDPVAAIANMALDRMDGLEELLDGLDPDSKAEAVKMFSSLMDDSGEVAEWLKKHAGESHEGIDAVKKIQEKWRSLRTETDELTGEPVDLDKDTYINVKFDESRVMVNAPDTFDEPAELATIMRLPGTSKKYGWFVVQVKDKDNYRGLVFETEEFNEVFRAFLHENGGSGLRPVVLRNEEDGSETDERFGFDTDFLPRSPKPKIIGEWVDNWMEVYAEMSGHIAKYLTKRVRAIGMTEKSAEGRRVFELIKGMRKMSRKYKSGEIFDGKSD